MKKILFTILILLFPLSVSASSASYVIMDASSGRILESKNMNKKLLIASTTKIMTSIVALENETLSKKIVVGKEINEVYGSMTYIKEKETFLLEDLLYGLMLQSGNDCAMVIAKHFKYDNFINMMNEKANELGMYNTTFENPHGLNDKTKNYSTAYDLALLMRYAMQNENFRKITSTKKYTVKTRNNTYIWYNKNKLLTMYKYTTGGKIGYTKSSSHVFVSSATKNNKDLIIATIKDNNRFINHKSLYEKTFKQYEEYKILDKYTFSLKSKYHINEYLYIKNDFYMLLKENEKDKLNLNIVLFKRKHKNNIVGYIKVILNEKLIHKENIYSLNKNAKINKLKEILFFRRQ